MTSDGISIPMRFKESLHSDFSFYLNSDLTGKHILLKFFLSTIKSFLTNAVIIQFEYFSVKKRTFFSIRVQSARRIIGEDLSVLEDSYQQRLYS